MKKALKYLVYPSLLLLSTACNDQPPKEEHNKQKETGWTPVDSNTIEDPSLPEVTEIKPKADSILTGFLPPKLLDYKGDVEAQNSNNKTQTGITIRSVVRVYRKRDAMIGINISDYSLIPAYERKKTFEYHQKSFLKMSKQKGSILKQLSPAPEVHGQLLYNSNSNKALVMLLVNEELLISISTGTQISIAQCEQIVQALDFKKIKQIKQIS